MPNTQKQRIRHNEETEDICSKQENRAKHSMKPKENRSDTPDRKLKVMIINVLTGLEKIMEDIIDILNKEVKKNHG